MQAFILPTKARLATDICSNCLRRLSTQQRPPPFRRHGLQARPRIARRNINNSRPLHESPANEQAQPLGDYYESLLSPPVPSRPATSSLPTFVQSGNLTKEQRAARLFGNIEGSGYEHRPSSPAATWKTINGVAVPPRPAEPDNCCMSGCVHCVWDDYRDDIEQWAGRLREAQGRGGGAHAQQRTSASAKADAGRPEVQHASVSMDDDGGGSEGLWDAPSMPEDADEGDELFQGIPVGIREFMATEKRIRERKRGRRKS